MEDSPQLIVAEADFGNLLQVRSQAPHAPGAEAITRRLGGGIHGLDQGRSKLGSRTRGSSWRLDREQTSQADPTVLSASAIDRRNRAAQSTRQLGLAAALCRLEDDRDVAKDDGVLVLRAQSFQRPPLRVADHEVCHAPTPLRAQGVIRTAA